jgi:hypothetical protein
VAQKTTLSDLNKEVDRLNKKYCKNTKNHLVVGKNGYGYSVNLTGKTYKRGKKTHWRKGSIGSGEVRMTGLGKTKSETIDRIRQEERSGNLKRVIRKRERG